MTKNEDKNWYEKLNATGNTGFGKIDLEEQLYRVLRNMSIEDARKEVMKVCEQRLEVIISDMHKQVARQYFLRGSK